MVERVGTQRKGPDHQDYKTGTTDLDVQKGPGPS